MKFKQRLKNNFSSPEAGYTIIESLVAMIMVSALMVAIAPVIAYSVGTRVQARRVELAAQAARSYIDGVRSGAIDAPSFLGQLPSTTSAPTGGGLNCEDKDGSYCGNLLGNGQLFCIDGDGVNPPGCEIGSSTDMVIQAGSYSTAGLQANLGYELMVRVYRADAFSESGTLNEEMPSTTVTNAIGSRRSPLAVVITEIAPTENSFQNIRDRLE